MIRQDRQGHVCGMRRNKSQGEKWGSTWRTHDTQGQTHDRETPVALSQHSIAGGLVDSTIFIISSRDVVLISPVQLLLLLFSHACQLIGLPFVVQVPLLLLCQLLPLQYRHTGSSVNSIITSSYQVFQVPATLTHILSSKPRNYQLIPGIPRPRSSRHTRLIVNRVTASSSLVFQVPPLLLRQVLTVRQEAYTFSRTPKNRCQLIPLLWLADWCWPLAGLWQHCPMQQV